MPCISAAFFQPYFTALYQASFLIGGIPLLSRLSVDDGQAKCSQKLGGVIYLYDFLIIIMPLPYNTLAFQRLKALALQITRDSTGFLRLLLK